jgi:hypothetical protein
LDTGSACAEEKKGPFSNLVVILCVGGAIFIVVILVMAIINMFSK